MKKLDFSMVIKAWLLAGTLDLFSAFADVWIRSGGTPDRVLQYIASGLIGSSAFQNNMTSIGLGLGIHYFIALFWTVLFFLLYPWIRLRVRSMAIQAITFGLFVWLVMNLLVLPLTQAETGSFQWLSALKGAAILMFAIGWPVAYFARKSYESVTYKN